MHKPKRIMANIRHKIIYKKYNIFTVVLIIINNLYITQSQSINNNSAVNVTDSEISRLENVSAFEVSRRLNTERLQNEEENHMSDNNRQSQESAQFKIENDDKKEIRKDKDNSDENDIHHDEAKTISKTMRHINLNNSDTKKVVISLQGSVEDDTILSKLSSLKPIQELNQEGWTRLRWLMELFDHHKWDTRHYTNVSKNCADHMKVYLNALKNNVAWAAKMSDASGRYNGQFFFGNDFWLGSSGLCKELQLDHTGDYVAENSGASPALREIPPFPATFSVARLQISIGYYTPNVRIVFMGICLPSSCSSGDLENVLRSGAAEAELEAKKNILKLSPNTRSNSTHEYIHLTVDLVRPVPGPYNLWKDPKFFVLGGLGSFIFVLIIIASIYEGCINRYNKEQESNKKVKNIETDNNNVLNGTSANGNGISANSNGTSANGNGTSVNANGISTNINGTTANENGIYMNGSETTTNGGVSNRNGTRNNENGNGRSVNHGNKRSKKLGTDVFSQILLSFSALSNTGKIMNTEESTEDSISCIHGLRFLSLAWVIMVHTYLQVFSVTENKTIREVIERNFFYQTVGNASYSVDTFFLISGLLLTFLYCKSLDNKKKILANKNDKVTIQNAGNGSNGHHFVHPTNGDHSKIQMHQYAYVNHAIVHESNVPIGQQHINMEQFQMANTTFTRQTCSREVKENLSEFLILLIYRIIRLTPAYLFVIGLNELSLRYLHNNSVFEPTILDHVNCDKYWWRNILYVNNFYPQSEMCMLWSWYMANDTQFYIIGVILLLVSKRHMKISGTILMALIVLSWLITGYISLANNYRAKIQEPFEMFNQLYDKPWSRVGPYLVGMITGWYLWKNNGKVVLPTWVVIIGWPCALATMASIIYGMKDGYLELWPTAFYVSIGHTAWSIATAWVVIYCVANRDGIVSKILSYKGAFPLSRLAYCAYLVHPTISMLSGFQLEGPIHMQNGIVLVIYAGITVMSYLMSFAISLAFEAPIVRLLKIDFRASRKKET